LICILLKSKDILCWQEFGSLGKLLNLWINIFRPISALDGDFEKIAEVTGTCLKIDFEPVR